MSVTLSPIGGVAQQFFDNNGQPLSGGKIYTYAAGTTTPLACYTSASGATPHSNPIILDSAGRVPGGEIWLTDSLLYKFVIYTSLDILLGSYDNITGINSNFVNYTTQEEVQTATAGQTVFTLTTMTYLPGTNSLMVFVDGVNQYAGDSFIETDNTTVTFTSGLHVGAEVKFTTAVAINTSAMDASAVSYTSPFLGSTPTSVEDKLAQYVSVKDFGAVGDGVTDDTIAIQTALDSGVKQITFVSGENYRINAPLTISASNILLLGNGATLTQTTTNTNGIEIGYNGSSFILVEDITISGLTFVGADNGLTTTASGAIVIYSTSDDPYTTSNGCQRIKVYGCSASGWSFGVAATGVNGLFVENNFFTGMKFHVDAVAGGYGVLAQTCFDVQIVNNRFAAQTGDRHAVYISADPSRAAGADNVCKQVVVTANLIDWSNVFPTTGFETCLMSRGVFDFTVSNNVFKGGYGGIDYELENASGENIAVTGNVFDGILNPGTSTRGAVNFLRSSGSNRASNVSITGNSIKLAGDYTIGVQLDYVDYAVVTGNTINSPDNPYSFGINCLNSTNVAIGSNTIRMGNGYAAISFDGANSEITINKNQITGANYFKFKFFTVPTDLKFGYVRTFAVSSDGAGTITAINDDETVIASATSSTFGVSITLEPWIAVDNLNISFSGANSSVGWVYYRSSSGSTVVCGVTDHSGAPLAAATNAYYVLGTVLS